MKTVDPGIIGKAVGLRLYLHASALVQALPEDAARVGRAQALAEIVADQFNVVRIERHGDAVALLDYPGFFDEAFPVLARSWRVDTGSGKVSFRDYRDSFNPPILHRKELLLPRDHPDIAKFARLTSDLQSVGLFEDTVRIGFRVQWEALLRERGYRVVGHVMVPIGNNEDYGEDPDGQHFEGPVIRRHLTALSRQSLSAPVSMMLRLGLLDGEVTFFDYGCGRGDDVAALRGGGIAAQGWDPHYAPDQPIARARIVNIGFVINVIEDPAERRDALRKAFEIAADALCVAAMLASENAVKGRPYADGVLTSRGTFQKYYTQAELRSFIEGTLEASAIALAPGVFLVFKDPSAEQRFQLGRTRSRLRIRPPLAPRQAKPIREPKPPREPKPTKEPKQPKPGKPDLWELCPNAFAALHRRWEELAREPGPEEIEARTELEAAFGSLPRALRAACSWLDGERLRTARNQRREDVLVYLALQAFGKRKPYRRLDPALQRDIKAFLGDYTSALDEALRLLASAASPEIVAEAAQRASEKGLGWLTEGRSLQLHTSLVDRLPAVLRVYVGCASVLYGDVGLADVVKIHLASGKVTLLRCDDFSRSIPKLIERVKVNLRTQDVRVFPYGDDGHEPPLMYLKSRFIHEEIPGYAEQAEFDRRMSELVQIDELSRGPFEAGLQAALRGAGLKISGTMLTDDDEPPRLNDPCGAHLTFRDLINCGETARRTGLPNLPKSAESYRALRALAQNILDPVIEWFGSIELTYGFCSPELSRLIPGRIAPALDQHAAHEERANGTPVCPRLGAAVDFLVRDEDMMEVAEWIAANTPFDRLYVYGHDQPLHVSYGPEHKREIYEMVPAAGGRRIPKRIRAFPAARR
ncbi:DNA phosphorothioation-associated putative methyltransferase [Azospirillum baldaniorum]|uniref:DNA phosphorothioation-associated putative methyltransferase n=1 Tax=Azospirillum baldaniorum TaxID=1064539 RepID=UPI0011A61A85|nr:DNA phosphorothioation-associated putative methyltransferase [Azospirillum baldaniorum]TWA66696.1 DNA phosphorothioation-associated putative methyltransferase [Azospirillum baldaniorum]